jgi:Ca-activated chloride channel family protein
LRREIDPANHGNERDGSMKTLEQGRATTGHRPIDAALSDFASLFARALLAGLTASLLLVVLTLLLARPAEAAALPASSLDSAKTGELMLATGETGKFTRAPRLETDVAITVTGMIARAKVIQHFHNPGADWAEGVYVFPLPENAAVDRLRIRIGDRLIEGEIREKDAARAAYVQAKREGKHAALVEQQRPNLFTNHIANIGPNEFVSVEIEYQQALEYKGGEYRLRFPLAVTPRYAPAGPPDHGTKAGIETPDEIDADEPLRHPDYEGPGIGGVNPVSIAVSIDAGTELAKIDSSYHEVWTEKAAGTRHMVWLTKEQEDADRDFELVWSPKAGAAPQAAAFMQTLYGKDYALVMVMPPEAAAGDQAANRRLPRETILIVDTSGSMAGSPMEQAKGAVLFALGRLGPNDRFNVIEFNSVMHTLFADAMPASEGNLAEARKWVGRLKANGGTEMLPALGFALDGRDAGGIVRQVVFVTDGAVENEGALLALIHRKLGGSRLFTVGIGSAPNTYFMSKAAQLGRGTFTYIGDSAEVQAKMSALFAKLESPVLKDVAIAWPDGVKVETYPARIPDLYAGEPLVVAAKLSSRTGVVTVTGLRGSQPWSAALTLVPGNEDNGVGALWARAKIGELMDALRTGTDAAIVRKAVIQVALEHHLVSRYTSLVAVDVTTARPEGAHLIPAVLKVNLPSGMQPVRLPQTATHAPFHFITGLVAALLALAVFAIGQFRGRK